jgi:hypothetical protein
MKVYLRYKTFTHNSYASVELKCGTFRLLAVCLLMDTEVDQMINSRRKYKVKDVVVVLENGRLLKGSIGVVYHMDFRRRYPVKVEFKSPVRIRFLSYKQGELRPATDTEILKWRLTQ